jgi:hypothetical protein
MSSMTCPRVGKGWIPAAVTFISIPSRRARKRLYTRANAAAQRARIFTPRSSAALCVLTPPHRDRASSPQRHWRLSPVPVRSAHDATDVVVGPALRLPRSAGACRRLLPPAAGTCRRLVAPPGWPPGRAFWLAASAAMSDAAVRSAWRDVAGQALLGLRLSAAVAAAAMVVAVPAALLHFLGSEWAFLRFGRGVMALSTFFDERHYVDRKPYIVAFNRTTAEPRLRYFAAIAPHTLLTALFFVCSYGSYLGGSGRVIAVMTAPVALIVAGTLVGIQLGLDSTLVINLMMYNFFCSTMASIYVLTPRDSKIAWQMAKQLLVYQLGFIVVQLPSNESSVRALDESEPWGAVGFGSLARRRRLCDAVAGRPGQPTRPTSL